MEQKFKYVGVTTNADGRTKVRFANELIRIKVLEKAKVTNINFVELAKESTKLEAVNHLATTELYSDPKFQQTIDEAVEKYSTMTTSVKTAKTVKAKSPTEKLANLKERAAKKTAVTA